jgi:molybdate transport system ATP-binding protein/molybdate transport system permease protein
MAPALEVSITKRLSSFTLDVSFTANRAPIGLLGASGAGKSMVLRAIAGLVRPDAGHISLDGRALFDAASGRHEPVRLRRIGLLFQNYALFPHLTVQQNIAFGLKHLAAPERARRTAEQIAAMHLSGFEDRYPGKLSGGQQQRVALARALAPTPAALLLDEPFSALDTHLRSELEHQLRESLQSYPGVTLIVSHNLEELYRLCGEFVVLEKGSVIASGDRDEIFGRPPNRATARLTGCKNFSRARALPERGLVEATDWGCSLQVTQAVPATLAHIAIRAHHIGLDVPSQTASTERNWFPVWMSAATEGPFRVTLYLRFHGPSTTGSDHHLQLEITREKWAAIRSHPLPWMVRLDPDRLFLLSD